MGLPPIPAADISEGNRDEDARWRLNWLVAAWFGWTWKDDTWVDPSGKPSDDMPDYIAQLTPDDNEQFEHDRRAVEVPDPEAEAIAEAAMLERAVKAAAEVMNGPEDTQGDYVDLVVAVATPNGPEGVTYGILQTYSLATHVWEPSTLRVNHGYGWEAIAESAVPADILVALRQDEAAFYQAVFGNPG